MHTDHCASVPTKRSYDITFAPRFWRGKQMIVCKQTMLCAFGVDWLFYQSLSRLDSLAFTVHQQSSYVTASRTQVCTEFDVVQFIISVK